MKSDALLMNECALYEKKEKERHWDIVSKEKITHSQSGHLLPSLHIPQLGSGIHAACGHQCTLGIERQAHLHNTTTQYSNTEPKGIWKTELLSKLCM